MHAETLVPQMLARYKLRRYCTPRWNAESKAQDGSCVMLVITRREGEEVVIGDPKNPIGVVRVASVKGERVRIAFDFPRDIEINRREVADQIAQQASEVIGQIKPESA
jgi:carbon storage regulator CsrA